MLTTNRLFLAGTVLALAASLSYCDNNTNMGAADMKGGTPDMTVTADMTTSAAPTIASIAPSTGSNAGGGTLTITGTGFQTGATVTVGGIACGNPNVTATQITCTIPAKATTCGSADVVVTNPDTQTVTNSTGFAYRTSMVGFNTAVTPAPTTGGFPRRIITGDFNGDGKMDVATANQNGNNVTVLLGQGNGMFTAMTGSPFTVGTTPSDLVAADVTGDGKIDIVTVNATSVSVLPGTGTGFGTATQYNPAGLVGGTALAVGDFNADMKLDLVVLGTSAVNINAFVLQNNGTGGYPITPTVSLTTGGTTPLDVEVADLDNDNKPDIVLTNSTASSISVFKGTGSNTFATKVDYTTGTKPFGLRVVDLNGDGKLDVVTANNTSNNVSVLLGTGTTAAPFFGTKADFATANTPESVIVADLNSDGIQDIATANAATNNWTYLLGMGNNAYAAAMNTAAGTTAASLVLVDLNADKLLDVAVANAGANTLTVQTQKCN